MFCNQCGEKVKDNQKFCPNCGAELKPDSGEAENGNGNYFGSLGGGKKAKRIRFLIATGCYLLISLFIVSFKWFSISIAEADNIRKIKTFPLFIFGGAANFVNENIGEANAGKVLWVLVSLVFILFAAVIILCGIMYIIKRLKGDADYKKFGMIGMTAALMLFILVSITAITGDMSIKGYIDSVPLGGNGDKFSFYMRLWPYVTFVLAIVGADCVKKS